jgi:hypothetical protein
LVLVSFSSARKINGALFLLLVRFSRSQSFLIFFGQFIELYITENIATRNPCIITDFTLIIFKQGGGSGVIQSHLKDLFITCQICFGEIEDISL